VDGRLESAWPVHGAVLVEGGEVILTAGRSAHLDGGIRFYRLDAHTGRLLTRVTSTARKDELAMQQLHPTISSEVQADVLVSGGDGQITMRSLKLDRKTFTPSSDGQPGLRSAASLLDDSWTHRLQLNVAGFQNGKLPISGKLVAYGQDAAYSVSTKYSEVKHNRDMWPAQAMSYHQMFDKYKKSDFFVGTDLACYLNKAKLPRPEEGDGKVRRQRIEAIPSWKIENPAQVRSLIVCGGKVVTSGWLDSVNLSKFGRVGERDEGVLQVWDGRTGKALGSTAIPAHPVYDGMAAAYGRLYVPLTNGTLTCLH
jgi:hypothetical protein